MKPGDVLLTSLPQGDGAQKAESGRSQSRAAVEQKPPAEAGGLWVWQRLAATTNMSL